MLLVSGTGTFNFNYKVSRMGEEMVQLREGRGLATH